MAETVQIRLDFLHAAIRLPQSRYSQHGKFCIFANSSPKRRDKRFLQLFCKADNAVGFLETDIQMELQTFGIG